MRGVNILGYQIIYQMLVQGVNLLLGTKRRTMVKKIILDEDKVINKYLKLKNGVKVAKVFCCSYNVIYKILKKRNIVLCKLGFKKGNISWNKNLKGEEYKKHFKNGMGGQFKKGNIPWTKGKTKENNDSLKKISKRMIKNNPMLSMESRIKVGLSKKGKKFPKISEATMGRISPMKGKKHTEENKRTMNLKKKGVPLSIEHKNKIIAYLNLPETKKKASENFKKTWKNKSFIEIRRKAREKQIFPKKDTKIEVKIQNLLTALHLEYFTHKYISEITHGYQCDIFIPIQKRIPIKTIIECDGDYWHGNLEKFNHRKLSNKIKVQRILDYERNAQLEEQGFRVIRLWEHEIKEMELNDFEQKLDKLCRVKKI